MFDVSNIVLDVWPTLIFNVKIPGKFLLITHALYW